MTATASTNQNKVAFKASLETFPEGWELIDIETGCGRETDDVKKVVFNTMQAKLSLADQVLLLINLYEQWQSGQSQASKPWYHLITTSTLQVITSSWPLGYNNMALKRI